MAEPVPGRCLCGTVRYVIVDEPLIADYCHCSRCQRWSGTPAEPSLKLKPEYLQVQHGLDALRVYESEDYAPRAYCGECGSSLFGNWGSDTILSVSMGTLEVTPSILPWCHFNLATKVTWLELRDGLPQFDELPPAYGESPSTGRTTDAESIDPDGLSTGRCLCGGVRYEVHEPLENAYCCHCKRCQRFSGSACATNVGIQRASLNILQGEELLKSYVEDGYSPKAFCSVCGSSLFGLREGDESASVRMGTLDGGFGLAPSYHIFVGSKAAWHAIDDEMPEWEELPE